VDEIIIADTCSTDDTVKIAESFGAKVFSYPWQNDFSAARNAVLDKAGADWILHLDTDELALLFAKAFEQTPQYWLNLQASYDLKTAEKSIANRLVSIHSLAHA
jgi:glycosyltransferase involved in cell wall biosynthesis